MTPDAAAPHRAARLRSGGQTWGALVALVLLVIYNILSTPRFLSLDSLNVLLTQITPILIVAVGMTLVMATGGIDLSVGSLMALAGAVAPLVFLSPHAPLTLPAVGVPLAVLAALGVSALLGLGNGLLVTAFRIQPIIATLILFIAGRGVAQVLTNGSLQTFSVPSFQFLGLGKVAGLPFQALLGLAVAAWAAWALRETAWGRYVLAAGDSEAAARLAGVPVDRVKRQVYTLSGLLAGVAGLLAVSINGASDAGTVGVNMELDAIVAVSVGGTPFTGGRATIAGTVIGAVIVQLIRTTLLSNRVPFATAQVINAALILVAVAVQRRRT